MPALDSRTEQMFPQRIYFQLQNVKHLFLYCDCQCLALVSGLLTKRAAIEAGLRALIRLQAQEHIRSLRGQL